MITQCPKTGRTCEVTGCDGCWKAEQAEQEPVAWIHPMDFGRVCETTPNKESDEQVSLYAAPVRTKDLTDDEIAEIVTELDSKLIMRDATELEIARAVIAADREKNSHEKTN